MGGHGLPASVLRVLLVSAALALAGCLGASNEPAPPTGSDRRETSDAAVEGLSFPFSGSITGNPAVPGEETFPFEVPEGAVEVRALLTWDVPEVNDVRVALLDPKGEPAASGFPERPGQSSAATLDPPSSGTWTAVVRSTRAVSAGFALDVRVSFLVPMDNVLSDSLDLGPGDFAELNLIMEEGATINFTFAAAGGTVAWNLHSHEDGELKIHQEGAGAAEHADAFTAPKREIYSLLFESESTPVTLSYDVTGAFRVHSHSQ